MTPEREQTIFYRLLMSDDLDWEQIVTVLGGFGWETLAHESEVLDSDGDVAREESHLWKVDASGCRARLKRDSRPVLEVFSPQPEKARAFSETLTKQLPIVASEDFLFDAWMAESMLEASEVFGLNVRSVAPLMRSQSHAEEQVSRIVGISKELSHPEFALELDGLFSKEPDGEREPLEKLRKDFFLRGEATLTFNGERFPLISTATIGMCDFCQDLQNVLDAITFERKETEKVLSHIRGGYKLMVDVDKEGPLDLSLISRNDEPSVRMTASVERALLFKSLVKFKREVWDRVVAESSEKAMKTVKGGGKFAFLDEDQEFAETL